jgi:hypothetical protein
MPQFVMCAKKDCPKSNECYRFRAIPEQDQLISEFINICNLDDDFHYFIRIRKDDKIVEVKSDENANNTEILALSSNEESLDNGICEESK